jgi:hypothetical protein
MGRWRWQDALNRAREALKGEPGRFEKAKDAYVLFRYVEKDVRLVFYPHKCPSASAHTVRVRVEPCKNLERAEQLLLKLPFWQKNRMVGPWRLDVRHRWAALAKAKGE